MMYHHNNSATRIHISAWRPTIPETWNMKIVVGKLISAVCPRTWQHIAVMKSILIGLECCKGLVFEPSYLIPIEVNNMDMRIVCALSFILLMQRRARKNIKMIVGSYLKLRELIKQCTCIGRCQESKLSSHTPTEQKKHREDKKRKAS